MATLSLSQMEMYARAAGLPEPKKWAAIGMAESGGRTDVVNSIGCVGIWQINQPVHVRSHPKWTVSWLKNPANNARAAKVIFDSQGWNAWEAYTGPDGQGDDGPWRDHADKAGIWDLGESPLNPWDVPWTEESEEFPGVAQAEQLSRIAQAIGKAGNWLSDPTNWIRVGYVAGGAVLLAVGVQMVVRTKLVGQAQKAVGGAIGQQRTTRADQRKRDARVREAYDKTAARQKARQDAKGSSG